MTTWRKNWTRAIVIASPFFLGACGSEPPRIVLDELITTEATTTATPASGTVDQPPVTVAPTQAAPETSTAPAKVVGERWVDATANLTDMESWCGNLSFVSARPGSDEVIAGVAGQGLFVDRSGSEEWEPYGVGPSSAPLDHRLSSVVYDPEEPQRFWESGFFGLGPPPNASAVSVNRTDDGGVNFVPLGDAPPADLVAIDFSDPDRRTMLVGTHGQPVVARSTDGGQTWSDVSGGLPLTVGDASFPYVVDATTHLIGTHKGEDAGVYRTTDGGVTWAQVHEEAVSGPPLASMNGNLYWVLDSGGVISSADNGASWTVMENRAVAGGERRGRIIELEDGTWLSRGVDYMLVSRDAGAEWQAVGPGLPYEPTGFTYSAYQDAVYIWRNYCDFAIGVNPVLPESIMRLDLDVG